MESHTETMFVHQVHALDDRNERFLKRHIIFKEALGGDSRFKFVLLGDNTPLADELDINDQVTVTFHIEGREWISPQEKQVIFTDMVIDRMVNLTNIEGDLVMADVKTQPQPQPDLTDEPPF